jgi:nucleoid-associated protein YgaU
VTKETKVGLLVGLAFIILFAIILSEKGATNNVSSPSNLTLADRSQPGGSTIPRGDSPLAADGKLPIETTVPRATASRNVQVGPPVIPERSVGVPIPRSEEDIDPLPVSVVKHLNYAPMAERQITLNDVGPSDSGKIDLLEAVKHAIKATPTNNTRLVINPDPEESLADARSDIRPEPNSRPIEVAPVRIVANHKVQSGESLGKIAAKYYGRSTPSRINAIFDVNRDRLSSVHAVRVGDMLRIPAIPDSDGISFLDAKEFAGAAVENAQSRRENEIRIPVPIDGLSMNSESTPKTEPAAPIEFKWYEVRENDTLSRIAKLQMGSARLYLKLYDFNRDLLPNKNSIKPGMKIRVPMVRAEDQVSSADYSRDRRTSPSN